MVLSFACTQLLAHVSQVHSRCWSWQRQTWAWATLHPRCVFSRCQAETSVRPRRGLRCPSNSPCPAQGLAPICPWQVREPMPTLHKGSGGIACVSTDFIVKQSLESIPKVLSFAKEFASGLENLWFQLAHKQGEGWVVS